MLARDFSYLIDSWISDFDQIDFLQLCTKPSVDSWSLGQVGMHLIAATNYYFGQIHLCLSYNDNSNEEMSAAGKTMFRNNAFPSKIIEGPPPNANTPQPGE